jgi:hypothetical protein
MTDDKITPEMIEEANRRAYGPRKKKRLPPISLDEFQVRGNRIGERVGNSILGMVLRGRMARQRQRRNADLPDCAACTWAELIRCGGPLAYLRVAAEKAAKQAAREEAHHWLDFLEENPPDDEEIAAQVARYIKALKRIAGIQPTADEIRAQTRERVRRFRERKAQS